MLKREFLAALTTFSTLAYILVVNPTILSESGIDFESAMFATILSSAIATLYMGWFAGYPFAVAPGMGLNAYFTYGLVLGQGQSWQTALGVCFYAGVLLLILTLLGIRQKILTAIPVSLRLASAAGIGIFLAFIGLKNVGIIISHESTLVTVGNLARIETLLAAIGVMLAVAFMHYNLTGSLLLSIFSVWILGALFGLSEFKGIVGWPANPSATVFKLDLYSATTLALVPAILSFVFVALFDSAGTLLSLTEQAGLLKEGKLPNAGHALAADGIGTTIGALTGTSPLTVLLESSSGIAQGGRTGTVGFFIALFFLLALFFKPLATSIPSFATAPPLIVIGALMAAPMRRIPWDDLTESIPAFIILITIPLTFSIATGIALGFFIYPFIKLLTGNVRQITPTIWILAALFGLKFLYL